MNFLSEAPQGTSLRHAALIDVSGMKIDRLVRLASGTIIRFLKKEKEKIQKL
jgi:hypothetical protein